MLVMSVDVELFCCITYFCFMWHSECLKLLSIKLILVSAATAVDCGDGGFSVSEEL